MHDKKNWKIVIEILGRKILGHKIGEKMRIQRKNCSWKIGVKNNFSKSKTN